MAGETKWNFWKLLKYAFDGIINFSEVPLSIASWSGIGMAFVASIMLVVIIVRRLCFGDPVAGGASTMCVIVFIGAIQLFCIGIMGQYLAKFNTLFDRQLNNWLHDYLYKKNYPVETGRILREKYEIGAIRNEHDFKEVLSDVLSGGERS